MTPTLLAEFIMVVNPRTLLQKDNKRKRVLHFIKYRRSNKDGKEKSARKDDAIAALIVGVAKVKPSLTQVLLQQSAEHAYVSAAKGLIEKCGRQIDQSSDVDQRTPREIVKARINA